MELLHNTGHDPGSKIDQKDPAPEPGKALVHLVTGADIPALKYGHQD